MTYTEEKKEQLEKYAKQNPELSKKMHDLSKLIMKSYEKELNAMTALALTELLNMYEKEEIERIPALIFSAIGMAFQQGYLTKEKELERLKK
jgi:predicted transcriptional regulator